MTMKKFTFEPSYDVESYDKENPKEIEHHFYASNYMEWATNVDFKKLHDSFTRKGVPFHMYFVPVHAKAPYQIVDYAPQGVDAHWLGTYQPK